MPHTATHDKQRSWIKLNQNWPDLILQNIQPPETVSAAVDRLMSILDGEHKAAIAAMREEDLIDLHFSLDLAIRNAFGLHEPESKLLALCGAFVHPDDASVVILNKLWSRLQHDA